MARRRRDPDSGGSRDTAAGTGGTSVHPEDVPPTQDERVEHPRRMPRRDPYRNRRLLPERVNGYDVKKG